jgi:hypothetical protein
MEKKLIMDWMVGSVFASKYFVCIEQKQWSAERANELCRLKNQA